MTLPPLAAFIAWIPLSLVFFRRFPIRVAILLTFLGGWAVLPVGRFDGQPSPYWILGNGLYTDYFLTKATVTSLAGLLWALVFDGKSFRAFRLTFWDLPMLVWCLVPLLSAIANPEDFADGMIGELYQILAWGVPWVLGRIYFSDTASLRLAAKAFVIAGLLYVPVCLIEIAMGPQIYAHLYGYQPYRWVRAQRYIGYRPIGLLETGTQLGIWMSTSALVAVWLWLRRTVDRVLGIPAGWAAGILLATTLLCQSGGSVVLLLALLPFVFVSRRYFPRICAVLLVFGIVLFAGLRLTNAMSVRTLLKRSAMMRSGAAFLKNIGRGSLMMRLDSDERTVDLALAQPILGSNQWYWWRDSGLRPSGLWLLAFGMYGIFGLLALEALQILPIVRVVWFPVARSDIEDLNLRHAFVAVVLMTAIDNLLNNSMILPLLVVMGGMSTWEAAASALHVEIESPGEVLSGETRPDRTLPAPGTIEGPVLRMIDATDREQP
ncbi:MAG: hypothetical protein JOZ33_15565 [Acidobacteriaceae bacterium]|nr:hypothetical protein [Acidobacteriaceae bacterium]